MKSKFLIGLGFYVVALSIYADPATPYQPHVVYYPMYDNSVTETKPSQATNENIGDDVSLDDFFEAMQKLSESQAINTSNNDSQKGVPRINNTSTIVVNNPVATNTSQANNTQPVNNISFNPQAGVLVAMPSTVTMNTPTVQVSNAPLPVVSNYPVVQTNPTVNATISQPVDMKETLPNVAAVQNNTVEYLPLPIVNTQVQISSSTSIPVSNVNTPQAGNQEIQPNLATPVESKELKNSTPYK